MEPDELFRTARRRTGLSQAAFALRAGLSRATVERAESGRGGTSTDVLSRALTAAGLELVPEPVLAPLSVEIAEHLALSLTRRLYRSFGGRYRDPARDPARDPMASPWTQLLALAGAGRVDLSGPSALGLWLPSVPPPVAVGFDPAPFRVRPQTPALRIVPPAPRAGTVQIPLMPLGWVLTAPTPTDLALHPECQTHRRDLLAVASALHADAPRDRAGRRVAAHKDPKHAVEQSDVFHDRALKRFPMPPATDVRSWRLDDDASLSAWLLHHGIPG